MKLMEENINTKKSKSEDGNKKNNIELVLMSLPAILIYLFLMVIPIIMAFYFALHNWNGIAGSPLEYVGFENFTALLTDSQFNLSLKNMFFMVFWSVLFHTPIALLLAVTLEEKLKGTKLLKIIYFVPSIFPLTAVGLLWYFILTPDGALNTILETIGLSQLINSWLIDPQTAMPAITVVNIWAGIGFYMVIIQAGLKGISDELYEAAELDGATWWEKLRYITIPVLKPVLFLCVTLDIISTIKIFDLIFAMTGGGPNGLTNLPTTLLYNRAFYYDNFGSGSAIGVVLLLISVVITLLVNIANRISEKRSGNV